MTALQSRKWVLLAGMMVLFAAALACDLFGAGPAEGKPTIAIVSPPSGTQVEVGQQINIQSAATDSQGVVRVELWVDGALYRTDASPSPQGQTSFSLVQPWTASTIGSHTLLVKAYNAAETASDPAVIMVNVVEAAAPGAMGSPTPTFTPAPGVTFTATPTATNTPVGPAAPGTCTDNAAFVADVTVPDGTSFSPGATINKVWRIKNNGTCAWGAGYKLAFVSGAQMGAPASQAVSSTAPGGTVDVAVTMYAPSAPGSYTGNWRMKNATGTLFGQTVQVVITVVGPATPTSTSPPPPTPTPLPPPPVGPSNLTASDAGLASITLAWQDNSGNEEGFKILRDAAEVGTVGANVTTYQDTGLTCNTGYNYQVIAYNAGGDSAAAASATLSTDNCLVLIPPPSPPAAPSKLTAKVYCPDCYVSLSWQDNSDNESGFKILRNGGEYTTVGANVTSFTDYLVSSGKSYSYTVKAFRLLSVSAESNTVEVTIP